MSENAPNNKSEMPKIIHTIAGSESTGSAGGQTDLRVFAAYKCFGFASWTSIVSFMPDENWKHHFVPLSPDLIREQLEASRAYSPAGVKIGMLGTLEAVDLVAHFLKQTYHKKAPIILDPVLVCKGNSKNDVNSNGNLENKESDFTVGGEIDKALIEKIFPLASVVTPNLEEAEILSGLKKIKTTSDMINAGEQILKLGANAVIIKGGNRIPGKEAIDVLVTNEDSLILSAPKSDIGTVTGAGCTFSASLAAELALQSDSLKPFIQELALEGAFKKAKDFTLASIQNSISSKLPIPAANPF